MQYSLIACKIAGNGFGGMHLERCTCGEWKELTD